MRETVFDLKSYGDLHVNLINHVHPISDVEESLKARYVEWRWRVGGWQLGIYSTGFARADFSVAQRRIQSKLSGKAIQRL